MQPKPRTDAFMAIYREILQYVSEDMAADALSLYRDLQREDRPDGMLPEDFELQNMRAIITYILARTEEADRAGDALRRAMRQALQGLMGIEQGDAVVVVKGGADAMHQQQIKRPPGFPRHGGMDN